MYDIENPYHKRARETGYPYSWQDEGENEELCLDDYFTKEQIKCLKEIYEECKSQTDCEECPFFRKGKNCIFEDVPKEWDV